MTQPHSLTWGLQFAGPVEPDTDYAIEAMADGTNFGNPQALFETIRSLLTDGSLVVSDGWDNREVPIRLRISAPRGIAGPTLAAAEAALMAQVVAEVKPPIVYVPPATDSATCVYDVVGAELLHDTSDGWDEEEVRREYRYYSLTLDCLPFVRGLETTVVPALGVPVQPGAAISFNLDTCDATTNWSFTDVDPDGWFSGALGITSGAVRVTETNTNPFYVATYPGMTLTRTGALSMAGLPYLAVDVLASHALYGTPSFKLDGVAKTPVSAVAVGSRTRYYIATGNFTTLAVTVPYVTGANVEGTRWLEVSNVARTDTLGDYANSTTRQQSRTATVSGSAPTTAAIRLFDATPAALGGEALVYTSRNASFTPALRNYRISSAAVTADTARISGGRNTLTTAMTFRIPANLLADGTHSLMGMLNVTTGGALTWSARMVDSAGATTLGSEVVATGSITLPVTTGYQILRLGAIPLPIVSIEGTQMVELTITGTANMTVDEMWLFNLDAGALTWVRNATVQWIEIRSPELGAPRQSVYGGTGAKGTNGVCIDWAVESFGTHRFIPGLTQIFTVCSSSLVSQSEIEFYERDHSHRTGTAA